MDAEKKLSEAKKIMKNFKKKTPEKMKAFKKLMKVIEKDGALSKKQKELTAIALAINEGCEWCISYHIDKALEEDATEEEILEIAWMTVLMGGGPSFMHSGLAINALEELS